MSGRTGRGGQPVVAPSSRLMSEGGEVSSPWLPALEQRRAEWAVASCSHRGVEASSRRAHCPQVQMCTPLPLVDEQICHGAVCVGARAARRRGDRLATKNMDRKGRPIGLIRQARLDEQTARRVFPFSPPSFLVQPLDQPNNNCNRNSKTRLDY